MGKEIQSYIQRPPAAAWNTGRQRGAFDDALLALVAFDVRSQKLLGDASLGGQSVAEISRLLIKICRFHPRHMDIPLAFHLVLFIVGVCVCCR